MKIVYIILLILLLIGASVLAYFFIFRIPLENNTAELNQLNMPVSFLNLTKTYIDAKDAKDVTALVPLLGAIKEKHRNYWEFTPKYEGIETAMILFDPENNEMKYVELSFSNNGMPYFKQLQKEFGKGEESQVPPSLESIYNWVFTYTSFIHWRRVDIEVGLTKESTNPESKVKRMVIH